MYLELSITQLRRQELHSRILLVCYQIMDHVILLPLSNEDLLDSFIEKDNGPCYIASSLKQYLCKEYNIKHIHGKPLHPQTQGKIERYHRSMKNVIKLNHYFCPSELENAIDGWVNIGLCDKNVLKILVTI